MAYGKVSIAAGVFEQRTTLLIQQLYTAAKDENI